MGLLDELKKLEAIKNGEMQFENTQQAAKGKMGAKSVTTGSSAQKIDPDLFKARVHTPELGW